jgi:[protein-PII] uridylyltransferase
VQAELAGEVAGEAVEQHLAGMGSSYLRQCPAALIARHIRAIHRFFADRVGGEDALQPLVEWRDHPAEGHTEVLVVTWDRERLFSKIAGSFAVAGCNILSADVFTRSDNVVIDTFRVCSERMEPVSHRVDRETFEKTLADSLRGTEDALGERLAGQGPTMWQKAIGEVEFPASLRIDTESEPGRTLLHVQAPDRVGLLHALTGAIADEGMQIGVARITTEKGAALDSFSLVDAEDRPITDPARQQRLLDRVKGVVSR